MYEWNDAGDMTDWVCTICGEPSRERPCPSCEGTGSDEHEEVCPYCNGVKYRITCACGQEDWDDLDWGEDSTWIEDEPQG